LKNAGTRVKSIFNYYGIHLHRRYSLPYQQTREPFSKRLSNHHWWRPSWSNLSNHLGWQRCYSHNHRQKSILGR